MTTRIIMRNDGRATAEGETEIFGTNGAQTVTILDGATVTFRSGFNTGGDTIRINGRASDFTVSISGSNVTFRSTVDNITVVIPIGTAANTITFDNGDSRSLSLVGGVPTLGAQTITAAGVAVTAGPGTFTIAGAASANEGGTITYTVTRTDTTSAETLLFSVDGSTNGGVVAAATQGADFSPASGVVTFAAGAATATFTVAVATDAVVEGLEGISVRVVRNGAVVASTNATIIDGQSQGQGSPLTAGVDTIVGTGGNDTVTGRLSEFSSLDTVTGGAGEDTLVLTGVLPADVQPQPGAVLDAAFERTTGIERLVLTGGTLAQSVNAVLGTLAADAGLREVVAGGTGAQAQVIDLQAFDDVLTVTGSGNAETIFVNLGTVGAKTLNLGAGNDTVNVAPVSAVAGSVQVNFLSSAVGNGTNDTVTIVSANGNVTVNDESTAIQAAGNASVFNVVGLAAAGGAVDPAQNRGNFGRIELGTGAGDAFATNDGIILSTYFNAGAGDDTFAVVADATERHFAVGGIGNDTLTAATNSATGIVVALMGDGTDTVTVNNNQGLVDINLGDGNDIITFTADFTPNIPGTGAGRDIVNGGAGDADVLRATSGALTAIDNTVAGAVQSVSGFEQLTVTDILANNLVTGRVQAGISTVNLNAGMFFSTVTFDSGLASTLNLAASAGFSGIRVASAGTGTADQVTIANTAGAVGGVAQNVFNGQTIFTTGVETLIINTSAAGSATTQTIGGISGTPAGRVNFVGSNLVNAGLVDARTVDASGLTGAGGIIATTTNTDNAANAFTGSAGVDRVTLGAGRQNLNLGAGNDTVVINAINNLGTGSSRLNGGDGIDTLQMNTADAATLSVTNIFNANNSGFEVLSLNRQLQGPANGPGVVETIRIDNIGTAVNTVISAGTADGTPGTGSVETVTFNAVALSAGQQLRIDANGGTVIVTGGPNGLTADQVAAEVRNVFNSNIPANGAVVEYQAGGAGSQVILTGTTLANQGNAVITTVNAPAPVAPTITETTPGQNVVAVREVFTLTLPVGIVPPAGAQFTLDDPAGVPVDYLPFTFTANGNQTGQALANEIVAQITAANAANQIGGQFTAAAVDGGNGVWRVVITANAVGARTDTVLQAVDPSFNGATNLALATTTQGVDALAVNEVQTVTFNGLTQGQSVTVAGRTVTAVTGPLTAAEVSDAFESAVPVGGSVTLVNGARIEGQVTNFTFAVSPGDAQTVLTATAPGNIAPAPSSVANAPLAAAPTPTIVDGVIPGIIGPAGTLIIQNLDSNGTLEINLSSNGTHEVRVTDSGLNTNDVLNLRLTNAANVVGFNNYGTIKVDNVETLNITTNDVGTGAGTAASQEVINFLDAAQVTSVTVGGNNGLFLGGFHNMFALTTFNASGVVGNAGDLRADLGVFFQSLNNTVGASVTITGGIGNDDFIGGRANDTYNLGSGGSDLVQFAVDRTINGQDVVNGFTAGSGANGDILDLAGVGGVTVIDGNGATAGVIFNATTSNTGDLVLSGFNSNVYLVTDGNATINAANIKDFTAATAQTGELLLQDGASAYVLHATSAGSNTFTVLRVFDGNGIGGTVDVRTEVLGTVNLTNTFGDLNANNFNPGFVPTQTPLTAAEVAAASAPVAMMGPLDNVASFAIA